MERKKNPKTAEVVDVAATKETAMPKVIVPAIFQIRWKKIGGGSLHLNDHIIKPGETFLATVDEIPKAFRDTIECLDPEEEKRQLEIDRTAMTTKEILYELALVEDESDPPFFNVVNIETKKVINEEPLLEEDATTLRDVLNA